MSPLATAKRETIPAVLDTAIRVLAWLALAWLSAVLVAAVVLFGASPRAQTDGDKTPTDWLKQECARWQPQFDFVFNHPDRDANTLAGYERWLSRWVMCRYPALEADYAALAAIHEELVASNAAGE